MPKLWFDDIRRPPPGDWIWARTTPEAMLALRAHDIIECSLDHDLGLHDFDPDEQDADLRVAPNAHLQPDGRDLLREMIAANLVPPKVTIHSWNHPCANEMALLLADTGVRATVSPFDPAIRG